MTKHEKKLKESFEHVRAELAYAIERRDEVGDPLDMVYGYLCDLYKDWLARVDTTEEKNHED